MTIKFFDEKPSEVKHPRIRAWEARANAPGIERIRIAIHRDREALGYGPAQLFVEFLPAGADADLHPDEVPWREDLDTWLVERGARAFDVHNEQLRFSLRLAAKLQPLLRRVGDGYFNSVFMDVVRASLASRPELAPYLHIRTDRAHDGGSLGERKAEVESVFATLAAEIREKLKYTERPEAERVLAGATAQYIDERFHVSDRKVLGL